MQVAQPRTTPVIPAPIARIGMVLAFAILLLAAGLAFAGVDVNGMPAISTAGYAGLFVAGVIASVTVILPVPMLGMVIVAAGFLNPFAVGFVAAAGISIGLWPTYFAGTAGMSAVGNVERSRNAIVRGVTTRVLGWFRNRPFLASFLLAAIPNPLFDWAGVMAGAAGVPFKQFLIGSFAGKMLQLTCFAMIGYLLAGHVSLPF